MAMWSRIRQPSYVSRRKESFIQFDESGYWLVRRYFESDGDPRVMEELLVAIEDIDHSSMFERGIEHREGKLLEINLEAPDESWPAGYGIIVDESNTYYLATYTGNPIAIELY